MEVFVMNQRSRFVQKLSRLFQGKGFYMVLLLCLVILGVSGYLLFRTVSGLTEATDQLVSGVAEVTVPTTAVPEVSQEITGQADAIAAPDETALPAANEVESALETMEEEPAVTVDVSPEETTVETQAEVDVPTDDPAEVSVETEESLTVIEPVPLLSWPLEGAVTTAFSATELTYNEVLADWRTHSGLDIAADLGSSVCAAASGVVESIASDPVTGTTLTLSHDGGMTTSYGNLDPDTLNVSVGDSVSAGDALACVGSSASGEQGDGTCFLHFSVSLFGEPVNPEDYLN
jgi:murein DD-endopeptidase MepM/ murein hydrolase activator NlpD